MLTRSLARPGLGFLVLLLALCPPLSAQRLGSITGTVRAATRGPGLEGARVILIGTELVVITNGKGEFAFQYNLDRLGYTQPEFARRPNRCHCGAAHTCTKCT